MKTLLMIISILLLACNIVFAASIKTFTLKDGSQIRGHLVRFDNGVYTVSTENLGQVTLQESAVLGITEQNVQMPSAAPGVKTTTESGIKSSLPAHLNADVAVQAQAMQAQIMSNPELVSDIQKIAENPELVSILSDPSLIADLQKALSSDNPSQVASDPRVQKLLSDPQMMDLIQKIYQSSSK